MHAHLTLSTLDCQQIHSKYPIHPHTHTELTVIVCMTVRRAKRRTCFQPYLEADEAQLSHIIYHAVAIASLFVSHIFISPGHALCFGDNNPLEGQTNPSQTPAEEEVSGRGQDGRQDKGST